MRNIIYRFIGVVIGEIIAIPIFIVLVLISTTIVLCVGVWHWREVYSEWFEFVKKNIQNLIKEMVIYVKTGIVIDLENES